jgi:NADH-quinone oxidoreductase subunit N
MLIVDSFSQYFTLLILGIALVVCWTSRAYIKANKLDYPEYYLLLLFSAFGMILLSGTLDLIVMFISLEIMSLCVYTLVAFKRENKLSNESAVKYFITGAVASAVYLYGTAHLYGSFGSFNLAIILQSVQDPAGSLSITAMLGICFLLVGFLIKVAAVPFHMWMPDVYEGAITPITGFMTTALKTAVFVALVRIAMNLDWHNFLLAHNKLQDLIWFLAALTMVAANLMALSQTNLKRMLGYSSIAHTGYLLIGFLAVPSSDLSLSAIGTYLVGYCIMNLGAFIVLSYVGQRDERFVSLDGMAGFAKKSPLLAFALATFLFSLAGIPPTVGFVSKYYLFFSAIEANQTLLVLIAVLCSAVSVFYYLRVIVYMYMREATASSYAPAAPSNKETLQIPWSMAVPVLALVILTLLFGVFPTDLLEGAKHAMSSFDQVRF